MMHVFGPPNIRCGQMQTKLCRKWKLLLLEAPVFFTMDWSRDPGPLRLALALELLHTALLNADDLSAS